MSSASQAPREDALVRLTLFGWRGGLLALVAALVASFMLAGYFVIYWRNADMDFMVVYSALAANAGKPIAFFDHPAYLTILSVEWWFTLLHRIGVLDAWSLAQIPSAADVPAFDAAMTQAVRAGRVLSFGIAIVIVLAFAGLTRRLTRDWRLALLATLALAFSGGLVLQMRIMRSEMIASYLVILPLVALMIAAREASRWRPLIFAATAMSCMLALENKVHAILLIMALPVLVVPCGRPEGASVDFWRRGRARWGAAGVAVLAALVLALAARPLVAAGLDLANLRAAALSPLLLKTTGLYQAGLAAWILLWMIVFAGVFRVSAAETVAAVAMAVAGAAAGLLVLELQYNPRVVSIVLNPLEQMFTIANMLAVPGQTATPAAGGGLGTIVALLLDGVVGVLRRYTFFLYTSPRPTVFLTWLVLPGILVAWRRGERQTALAAALLMLTAIGIDALGMQRNLKPEYFNFTDPLIILAGVLLLERMADLRYRRLAYPIGAVLIALQIGVSQAEPLRHMLKKEGAADGVCDWNTTYMPLLPLPWCDLPPKRM